MRADAFVGAIDLFPAVAPIQQQQLISEFKNVLASCLEEPHSSAAARAFNRCIVKHVGPLYSPPPLTLLPLLRFKHRIQQVRHPRSLPLL